MTAKTQRHKDNDVEPIKNIGVDICEIAEFHINQAIKLYETKTLSGFVCAVTLAGAADEMLGKYLEAELNQKNALSEVKEHFPSNYSGKTIADSINLARNLFKHFKPEFYGQEISIDPEQEARSMISRSIINYAKIENKITHTMNDFIKTVETAIACS